MSSAVDLDHPPSETRPPTEPHRRGDWGRALVRGVGQTLMTFGLVALLFVVYQLWVTDVLAARQQDQLTQDIQEQWADAPIVSAPETAPPVPAPSDAPSDAPPAPEIAPAHVPAPIGVSLGQPFAVMHIPTLGAGWSRVVVEGAAGVQLEQGPGHYIDTALPGEQGNFAVAGHRVGRGSPFLNLDRMQPGDPIVVETSDTWYVYRVLGDPSTGDFGADPSGIPGQQIVRPTDVQVISPTPGGRTGDPATGAYLTLTTCHPRYSAEQRLIVHARLDGAPLSKATTPDGPPALRG